MHGSVLSKSWTTVFLIGCLSNVCDNRSSSRDKQHKSHLEDPESKKKPGFRLWASGPNFDTDLPQDVTGVVGQTAYLTCRVFDRTNKTISWIRHADLHILTVGRYTYTADNRYQSIYNPNSDEWILQIKYLLKKDSGMYECQVSTQPVRSFFVRLNIIDEPPTKLFWENKGGVGLQNEESGARAEINGGNEIHVEQGSTLNLTCLVKHVKTKPQFLLWYHGNETIDYTSPRGGISVVNSDNSGKDIASTLLIYQVDESDSGKYSCRPSNTDIATTTVYVITDEHQENLKSINKNSGATNPFLTLMLILPLLFMKR